MRVALGTIIINSVAIPYALLSGGTNYIRLQ